jgi:hypothetical protein
MSLWPRNVSKKLPKKLKDEKGQAAIFMALFAATMIMLFAFTTNIGMLVHAKINLQNAADAAAYAGAAVQARQLTAAAYLNWEMRRALKEFLYYYTVRSQYTSQPCFPLDHTGRRIGLCPPYPGDTRHMFNVYDPRPGEPNEEGGPYLPSVCVIFSTANNYCQKKFVPGIPEFPSGGGWGVADPIVAAVRAATNQIISKKLEDCEGRTYFNQRFIVAWLFNLSPFRDENSFFQPSDSPSGEDAFPFSNGLERLGVLPRMAILRARIDNYEEALNMNLASEGLGSVTITDETMGALRGVSKPLDYYERPIQSYLSAKNNLPQIGEENGNFAEVELTELLPNRTGSVEANPNLKNPPVLAKFNDLVGNASFANSFFKQIAGADRGNCSQTRELRTINRFPFGVTKDPSVITYYAVRLQAKARLLFSPFGGNGVVTLSAYSAAKPFGSRIGRHLNPEETPDGAKRMMMAPALLGGVWDDGSGGKIIPDIGFITGFSPTFPNVLVADGDTTSDTQGFTSNAHLGYLVGAMRGFGNASFGPRLAGAYAPWEIGYYTPPANYNQEIIGKFEDNPIYAGKFFTLVAPIFPVNGSNGEDLRFIKERVEQYLIQDFSAQDTLGGKFKEFLDVVLSDDKFAILEGYLTQSRETLFHYVPDPLLSDEPDLVTYAKSVGSKFTVAGMPEAYKRQLTSWNNQKTATDGPELKVEANSELGLDMGRSGYSVRFISFDSLKAGGRATNDPLQVGLQWTNPFERLDAGGAAARIFDDLNKLKH